MNLTAQPFNHRNRCRLSKPVNLFSRFHRHNCFGQWAKRIGQEGGGICTVRIVYVVAVAKLCFNDFGNVAFLQRPIL